MHAAASLVMPIFREVPYSFRLKHEQWPSLSNVYTDHMQCLQAQLHISEVRASNLATHSELLKNSITSKPTRALGRART
jgi:hypothetical protein